jgi:hypothetical protein
MVLLQRVTGMRPAEVCQIRPCDEGSELKEFSRQ